MVDQNDCGKKYICELAAMPLHQLRVEEQAALAMVGDAPEEESSVNTSKLTYREAVRIGLYYKNISTCKERYKQSHPTTPTQYINILKSRTDLRM